MSLISGVMSLIKDAVEFREKEFNRAYSSAQAIVLSMQLEQALEADQTRASPVRFTKIWDAEVEAFVKAYKPEIEMQEILDKVKLPTELVLKYFGQEASSDPFQVFHGKEKTAPEIRQYVSKVSDGFDEPELPSLETIFSESHAKAETQDYIKTNNAEFEDDKWPFNSMPPEPKDKVQGPWSYLASFGAPYVTSLLSLDLAKAMEADIEQMNASGEAPSLEGMGKVCRETADKFIEANFEAPVDLEELLFEVELPTEMVQKYLPSMTFAEGAITVTLKQIQQQMEPSSKGSLDDLKKILPSLKSHIKEAHEKVLERIFMEDAKKRLAALDAEFAAQQAPSTPTFGQGLLSSLPSLPALPSLPWTPAQPAT